MRLPAPAPSPAGTARSALSGVLAALLALGVSELAAGLLRGAPSLVLSVGARVVDTVPGAVERRAIDLLGTADKPVLLAGILLLSVVCGALLGILAARRFLAGAAGLVAFAVLGGAAALGDPRASGVHVLVVVEVGAVAGVLALWLLLRAARAPAVGAAVGGLDRRGFLRAAVAAGALAAVGGLAGQLLETRQRVGRIRAAIRLPEPVRAAPAAPAGASLDVAGLTPLYVPNARFYRIDTALRVPQVDPATWSLRVHGEVERPFELSYDELLALPQVEADITIACVSNEVGGSLVGNARWQGVPLRTLLERAGVRRGGTQLLGRSVDGFTAGFPTDTALGLENAMVAVGMNGEPLPTDHGFPARIVVPGLFGYVSATKWLSEIELTDSSVEGYWIPRGWAKEGPVLTQSRIDVPASSATVTAGATVVAGVAWAPARGIRSVEVRVDDGPWEPAELAAALGDECWRQWRYRWQARPGRHRLTVRATDGDGMVQTAARAPVSPSGATGHHRRDVEVQASGG
jgi:DMSO/TMAO reductase YedYZ molybdopterin-dependent catalytic subunit